MIGLDTNVVVRWVVQDEPEQSAAASMVIDALTEKDPGFLSLVTVVELHWVLRRADKISTIRCAELIEGLLDARELRTDRDSIVRAALTASRRLRTYSECAGPVESDVSQTSAARKRNLLQ